MRVSNRGEPLGNVFVTALVIAWLAAFQWVLLCVLMDKGGK
jgi:hypothetical protein